MVTDGLKTGSGEKPLWSQIYDILKSRIETGWYDADSVLPTEADLMKEFGVSRITIRQAMNSLMQEGLIQRRRGSGTTIRSTKERISTSVHMSIRGAEHNHQKDRRLVSVEFRADNPSAAKYFGVSCNYPLLTITRESCLEGHRVVYYTHRLSPVLMLDDQTDFSGSMYEAVRKTGYPIDRFEETITAMIASEEQKELFKAEEDCALIRRVRKGYHGTVPIEYTDSLYLADDYEVFVKGDSRTGEETQ